MIKNKEQNDEKKIDKIDSLPSRSGNKTVYLVVIGCGSARTNLQYFVTRYLEQKPTGIEFVGYEINAVDSIQSHQDALDKANKGSRELLNIMFPWHRVMSIRNVTYTLPQQTQNNTIIGE